MMVVRGTSNLGSGDLNGVNIHPADRCTWQQTAVPAGGYAIDNALFWTGGGTPENVPISNPELGFIGKSGRFVRIAD